MVSWKTVLKTGNKKIQKKILQEGEAYHCPNECATVTVELIGKLDDGTVFVKKGHNGEEPLELRPRRRK